jgi:hypothetical protein
MPAAYAAGSAVLAGALGTAYTRRAEIADSYTWLGAHVKYVGHLWEAEALKSRLARIDALSEELGIPFRK